MKRLTITLTDEEYADLERRAGDDRRTVRDMAAFLVTKPQGWTWTPDWTWRPQVPPVWRPTIWSSGTTNLPCPACTNPDTAAAHTCLITWGAANLCAVDPGTRLNVGETG